MAKQLGFDEIIEQLNGVQDQTRKDLVAEILTVLRELAEDANENEAPGFQAAIEVIEDNFYED